MSAAAIDAVRRKFADGDAAGRWNDLYAGETGNLEARNFRLRRDVAVAEVLTRIAGRADARVLDLGCGTGPVLDELHRRGVDAFGIDCSEHMLLHARERLGVGDNRALAQADSRLVPCAGGSFDVVVCLGVISYLPSYEMVLAEIHRLLKPGGTALVSFRNVFNPLFSDPFALARRALRLLLSPLLGPRPREAFAIGRLLDHREVNREAQAVGLQPDGFFGIGFGPFRLGGRPLFGECRAIRISYGLERCFAKIGWRRPQPWLADVSLWIYRKPEGVDRPGCAAAAAGMAAATTNPSAAAAAPAG
jgi:2-polyprenyl-3-methyl-5-hydroxy-6-metoxy-1,4-benzoquinol methylase